jgi:hypothetical protein
MRATLFASAQLPLKYKWHPGELLLKVIATFNQGALLNMALTSPTSARPMTDLELSQLFLAVAIGRAFGAARSETASVDASHVIERWRSLLASSTRCCWRAS